MNRRCFHEQDFIYGAQQRSWSWRSRGTWWTWPKTWRTSSSAPRTTLWRGKRLGTAASSRTQISPERRLLCSRMSDAGPCSSGSYWAGHWTSVILYILYLSSGFVPLDAMPGPLAAFARYQPMTPVIETMRSAFLGMPLDIETALIFLLWCIGLTAVFCFCSLVVFRKRISQ